VKSVAENALAPSTSASICMIIAVSSPKDSGSEHCQLNNPHRCDVLAFIS
jgi:hypothetical protein